MKIAPHFSCPYCADFVTDQTWLISLQGNVRASVDTPAECIDWVSAWRTWSNETSRHGPSPVHPDILNADLDDALECQRIVREALTEVTEAITALSISQSK